MKACPPSWLDSWFANLMLIAASLIGPSVTVPRRLGIGRAEALALRPHSVQTIITSPPYWGQRDYGYADQSGIEPTYLEYLAWMTTVLDQLWQVLVPSGTLWLVVNDTYNTRAAIRPSAHQAGFGHKTESTGSSWVQHRDRGLVRYSARQPGLKDKDLMGLPWRLALAAQAAGWWLRCDVIWNKPSATPENAPDRPIRSHEYIFLLSKRQRAVKSRRTAYINANRSVWTIPQRSEVSGPAPFPDELVFRCLEATSDPEDVVLDPFSGSGTTARVANQHGRIGVGFDAAPPEVQECWRSLSS